MKEFYQQYKKWLVTGAVVVIAAVGVYLAASNNSSPYTINKDVQTKCLDQVKDKLFCKFAGTFANINSYTTAMTSSSGGKTTTADISIASNGNSKMVVKEGGATTATIVAYSGVTYIQDPSDNQWLSYPVNSTNAPAVTDIRKELAKGDFKNTSGKTEQYINKGTEVVNGLKCHKYQIIDPDQPGQQGYMWFDTKDLLLRKLSSKDSSTDLAMTFAYGTVSIAQPSPVKGSAE